MSVDFVSQVFDSDFESEPDEGEDADEVLLSPPDLSLPPDLEPALRSMLDRGRA